MVFPSCFFRGDIHAEPVRAAPPRSCLGAFSRRLPVRTRRIEQAFAERCRDDPASFSLHRIAETPLNCRICAPSTRELMADAERDLGTRLDWVAVDHWNTDNPHVHVLIRGRGDDGKTWSSAAPTSAGDFATAPPSGSPWSWGLAACRKSVRPWKRSRGRALDQPRPGTP